MNRAEALNSATVTLRKAGLDDPGRDARVLLRWAAGLDAARLTSTLQEAQGAGESERYRDAIEARATGRPVAQITGEREFWGRSFKVTPDVLDPRPETEILIAAALEGAPARHVFDLGLGTGCILLTLLAEWRYASGFGVDASTEALDVARENANRLGVADRAEFKHGDWFDGVVGRFDLIVSNPPYITDAEFNGLDASVRRFEPRIALTPGGDGLGAYRVIAAGAESRLTPGGRILLEVGEGQADAVESIFEAQGFAPAGRKKDFDGRDRCVTLRRKHELDL